MKKTTTALTLLLNLVLASCGNKVLIHQSTPSINKDTNVFAVQKALYNNHVYHTVMAKEGEAYYVDLYQEDSQGWPHKISSKRLSNLKEAALKANLLLEVNNLNKISRFQELIQKEKTLLDQEIWPTRNAWSEEWEEKFSQWIRKEVDVDFFMKNKVAIDCADVAIALRWIFSRMNYLPAAFHLGANNRLFSNESSVTGINSLPTNEDWRQDQRFRKSLDYLLDGTYTHTLFTDSYPVAIRPKTLSEGSFHLNLHGQSGHTQVIYRTDYQSEYTLPFKVFSSGTPREVRTIYPGLVWASPSNSKSTAFKRVRWAQKDSNDIINLLDERSHPWYSEEQFDPHFPTGEKTFVVDIYKKLKPRFDIVAAIKVIFDEIEEAIISRIEIVNKGWQACQGNKCAIGSSAYEAWSTPSRDARILTRLGFITILESSTEDPLVPIQVEKLRSEFKNKRIDLGEGKESSIDMILFALENMYFSFDPNKKPELRWAATTESLAEALESHIDNLLKERHDKINLAKRVCANSDACKPGTKNFIDLSTFDIDFRMARLVNNVFGKNSNYCYLFPKSCQNLQNELEALKFNWRGESISIVELRNRILNIHSSAFLSEEQKWESNQHLPIKYIMPRPHMGKVDRHSDWVGEQERNFLINIKTGEKLVYPGFELNSLEDSQAIFLKKENRRSDLLVVNLKSHETAELVLGQPFSNVTDFQNIILIQTNDAFLVYKKQDGSWFLDLTLKKDQILAVENDREIFAYSSGNEVIINTAGGKILKFEFKKESILSASFECAESICLLQLLEPSGKMKNVLFNSNTGAISPLIFDNLWKIGANIYGVQRNNTSISLFSVNQNLQVESEKITKDNIDNVFIDHGVAFLAQKNKTFVLHQKNNELQELILPHGAVSAAARGNLIAVASKNAYIGNYCYDLNSNSLLFTSTDQVYCGVSMMANTPVISLTPLSLGTDTSIIPAELQEFALPWAIYSSENGRLKYVGDGLELWDDPSDSGQTIRIKGLSAIIDEP